ncbi:hypothetical protein GDO81_023679 [Engystomops pustulosus]|uniref:Uncharacterized protein n=1 Tax=Engystomops pustulosus TaxID=76066 RepID=A0AAV6YV43_ENGPU|nr:hypothetical protein GDO81_023679 [Engystomops pustulosus]
MGSVSVCGNSGGAGEASAARPDSKGGSAVAIPSKSSAVVRPPVGGGDSPALVAASGASAPLHAVAANHSVMERRQCGGVAEAEGSRPPKPKVLFCVGVGDNLQRSAEEGGDQRCHIPAKDQRRLLPSSKKSKITSATDDPV